MHHLPFVCGRHSRISPSLGILCWHVPASCNPPWLRLRGNVLITGRNPTHVSKSFMTAYISLSQFFTLSWRTFLTNSSASSLLRQLRCIEGLENAIQLLNTEYECVEKVKGEVMPLKGKGVEEPKKKRVCFLEVWSDQFTSIIIDKTICQNSRSNSYHLVLALGLYPPRLIAKIDQQVASSTAACHLRSWHNCGSILVHVLVLWGSSETNEFGIL